MENDSMRSVLWRNRAVALLAGLIFALSLLSGLPGAAQDFLFAILSLVIIFISLAPIAKSESLNPNEEKEESAQSLIDRYFSE